MPQIPQIVSDQNPRSARLPYGSIAVAAQPGEAAARLGDAATQVGSDILDKLDKLHQASVAIDATAKGSTALEEFYQNEINRPPHEDLKPGEYGPPPPTLTDSLKSGFDSIIGGVLKGIRDPEVKLHVQQQLLADADSRLTQGRGLENKRRIDLAVASLDESTKLQVNLAANTTDNSWASHLIAAHSNVASILHAGAITQEQAVARNEKIDYDVQYARAKAFGVKNPTQTANDLEQVEGLYPAIPPVVREDLIKSLRTQADTNANKAEEARIKQDKLNNEAIVSHLESKLDPSLPPSQRLTHTDIQEAVRTLAATTAPMSRTDQESLQDQVDKKTPEKPSDSVIHDSMSIAVQLTPPTISQDQLYKRYLDFLAGNPGLNLTDFTKLNTELKAGLKAAESDDTPIGKARTMAQQVLTDRLGTNRTILSQGLVELSKTPAFSMGLGDMNAAAIGIADKYKAAIDRQGGIGVSTAAAQGNFESARKSYLDAVKNQTEWNTIHYFRSAKSNPNNDLVIQLRESLSNAARAAGKDFGPAPPGKPEGKPFIGADGNTYIVINGRTMPL